MNTVAPDSTTAALAAAAPLEKKEVPGEFPETPATDADKEFKVSPLPAADGAVNPVKLAPGEKIPESTTSNGIQNHVTLDKESYEKSDRIPGLEVPPITDTMIPESSLPIVGGVAILNSAAADSSTAALAGQVPLEPKVPAVVKESQEKAGVDPEASAVSEEVKEKAQVESELLSKVSEAPSTSEGTAGKGTDKSETDTTLIGAVSAVAATAGATALATAVAAKDTVASAAAGLPDSVKQVLPTSVQDTIASASKEATREQISPEVPEEVKASITEAGQSPEAAANTVAVEEKKEVEAELLKTVIPAEASGEPAPKIDEATSETATGSSKAADPPVTAEKKKKNRLSLSAMFSKLRGKKNKDKA
jgi:hypothetical protein